MINSKGREICQVCGKIAIGMQILGCCTLIVCEEHADKILKDMLSGETLEFGVCYYVRY